MTAQSVRPKGQQHDSPGQSEAALAASAALGTGHQHQASPERAKPDAKTVAVRLALQGCGIHLKRFPRAAAALAELALPCPGLTCLAPSGQGDHHEQVSDHRGNEQQSRRRAYLARTFLAQTAAAAAVVAIVPRHVLGGAGPGAAERQDSRWPGIGDGRPGHAEHGHAPAVPGSPGGRRVRRESRERRLPVLELDRRARSSGPAAASRRGGRSTSTTPSRRRRASTAAARPTPTTASCWPRRTSTP